MEGNNNGGGNNNGEAGFAFVMLVISIGVLVYALVKSLGNT